MVDGTIRYTPRAGFSGTDTFTYTITTANGTSTATVTVRVPGGGAAAAPAATEATVAPAGATLPATGGPSGVLATLGGLLLLGGAGVLGSGRRGRRALAR